MLNVRLSLSGSVALSVMVISPPSFPLLPLPVTVSATGVSATGYVRSVLVWGLIDDSQTPNWVNIDDSQTITWSEVDDAQTPDWLDIAA